SHADSRNYQPTNITFGIMESPPAREGKRSEEHTSELQSLTNLVCRLLLEKKKTDSSVIESSIIRYACTREASRAARWRSTPSRKTSSVTLTWTTSRSPAARTHRPVARSRL